jgi:hypothetical protein
MFGLPIRRHRLFETNFYIQRLLCKHHLQKEVVGVYGKPGGVSNRRNQTMSSFDDWKRAMEIDWMSSREIAQAVPPAYTFYISKFITEHKTIKFINSPH